MNSIEASKKAREIAESPKNIFQDRMIEAITQALIEASQKVIVENAGNGPITISKDGSGVFLVSSDIKWPKMPMINEDDEMSAEWWGGFTHCYLWLKSRLDGGG